MSKNIYLILGFLYFLSMSMFLVYYTYLASSSQYSVRWSKLKKQVDAILPRTSRSREYRPLIPSPIRTGNKSDLGRGSRPFNILFWTNWYGHKADGLLSPVCRDEFIITSNRSAYEEADVIVFQFVDIYGYRQDAQYPPTRDVNVPWILASQEASIQYPLSNGKQFDRVFNWTYSLRGDSLIHPNFTEMFEKFEEPDKRWIYGSDFSKEFLRNKTKTGSWVVSNCRLVHSLRNQLVSTLSKEYHIQIDIYGNCGNSTCPIGEACFSTLGLSYRFYFALENSLCEDYITEKIYHGLLHGMVPVVYALGNVGMNAPPNSFINVLDFPTLSALAERLKYLDGNPEEYFKYFEWRRMYNVNITGSSMYWCYPWRKMKEYTLKLRGDGGGKYRHVYDKFSKWYNSFYNRRLRKRCKVCLDRGEIDIKNLTENKRIMYEDPSRCAYDF